MRRHPVREVGCVEERGISRGRFIVDLLETLLGKARRAKYAVDTHAKRAAHVRLGNIGAREVDDDIRPRYLDGLLEREEHGGIIHADRGIVACTRIDAGDEPHVVGAIDGLANLRTHAAERTAYQHLDHLSILSIFSCL